MPFEAGQVSNPTGRPKSAKIFKEALMLAVKRAENDQTKLQRIANALVEKACAGDVPAINAVADRLDGKPTQPISGDDDAPPILARIENVIIDNTTP